MKYVLKPVIYIGLATLIVTYLFYQLFHDPFNPNQYFKKNEALLNKLSMQFLFQNEISSITASFNSGSDEFSVVLKHTNNQNILNEQYNVYRGHFSENRFNKIVEDIKISPSIVQFCERFDIPTDHVEYWIRAITKNNLYAIKKPTGFDNRVVITVKESSHRFIYSKDPNVDMYIEAIRINRNWWYCSIYCD